jgi:hypothetical protein
MSLSAHRDYDNFIMVYSKSSPKMTKVFRHAQRIRLKKINVLGGYAKSILPYVENTPIRIKFSNQTKKNSTLSLFPRKNRMGQKPSHATVPLKYVFHIIVNGAAEIFASENSSPGCERCVDHSYT